MAWLTILACGLRPSLAAFAAHIVMSEAANFPELATFYQQKVIPPGRALIRGVLQRGVDTGEFVIEDIDNAVFIVMAR